MTALRAIHVTLGSRAQAERVMMALKDAGYVCVPMHATPKMIDDGWASSHDENAQATWRDMVESALETDAELDRAIA